MGSSILLKKAFSSDLLFSKLARPAVATDAFGRFSSMNRRMYSAEHDYKEVSLCKEMTTPRSFKREDAERVYLFVDMPGIVKQDVEANVKRNSYRSNLFDLTIKAKAVKDYECESRYYNSSFKFPENEFKTKGIKADMKDGVLKVTLPKLKEVSAEDNSQEIEIEVN